MRKLKETNFVSLKHTSDIESRCWKTIFVGEGSYDDGGPFKESLANIVEELMSDIFTIVHSDPEQ